MLISAAAIFCCNRAILTKQWAKITLSVLVFQYFIRVKLIIVFFSLGAVSAGSVDKIDAGQKARVGLEEPIIFHFSEKRGVKRWLVEILKYDEVEGAEVLNVELHEIRNSTSDKTFSSMDRQIKTIYLNDTARVLEGSFTGDVFGAPGLEYSIGSPKSPELFKKPWEEKENIHDFITKGIGMEHFPSAKLRVGPLKGHLCGVVAIYRSDITIKVDSQIKDCGDKMRKTAVNLDKGGSVAENNRTGWASGALIQDSWGSKGTSQKAIDNWGSNGNHGQLGHPDSLGKSSYNCEGAAGMLAY
ncbi:hypothetical protein IFM89_028854 [Coptis chinensis]|uniref:Uncharacterized protein n=1 Tax=Coptis chinensis TaxID=261450 RepID=A0A835H9J4_9MAGN|nr:hypothetical protein IFM89_028854 [Coptis chinensis]